MAIHTPRFFSRRRIATARSKSPIRTPSVISSSSRPGASPEASIIVIVATDAPLLPGQCERLAQRAALGIGRVGGAGEHGSGDLILAFATGNRGLRPLVDHDTQGTGPVAVRAVPADLIDNLFYAVIEATEEAIVNALVAGETMTGRDGYTVQGIGGERLAEYLGRTTR